MKRPVVRHKNRPEETEAEATRGEIEREEKRQNKEYLREGGAT